MVEHAALVGEICLESTIKSHIDRTLSGGRRIRACKAAAAAWVVEACPMNKADIESNNVARANRPTEQEP
jgi:hypothetical protein